MCLYYYKRWCKPNDKNNGLFGVPKVMWSNGLGTYPVVDKKGETYNSIFIWYTR